MVMFASWVDRGSRIGCTVAVLLMVALSAITPVAIAGAPLFNRPLGEIRGTSPAQVSFDGKSWISLGSGTLPVFDKMLVRARSGIVALTLSDGSRLEASPTTELAIAVMGPSTTVRMAEGNMLFRLRPSSSVRLWMPGGMIQTAVAGMGRSDHNPIATRVSTDAQAQRDTLGVITAQRGGTPRIRLLSGEAFLVSQNGSVTERLREGQVRTMLAQSVGGFKQYAAAQPGGQRTPPPTDPPSQGAKPEHVWTWHPSHPQGVQGGWQENRLGVPPVTPAPPEQDVREGFAWAWKDQWVVAKRECGQFAAFRRASSGEAAKLPPPVSPPSQAAKSEHVWAWHPSNPPQVSGGWQEVQLGSPNAEPPRPTQDLYDGFTWAWEEKPEERWVVVEECGLAAAFFVPAAGWGLAAAVTGGTAGATAGGSLALHSNGNNPVASDVAPK
jgi:hypothetical protein